jgi:hypothetical protein
LDFSDPESVVHVWPDGKDEWLPRYLAEALDSVLSILEATVTAGGSRSMGIVGKTNGVGIKD